MQCKNAVDRLLNALKYFGVKISDRKSVLKPKRIMVFYGIQLDLKRKKRRLDPDFVTKVSAIEMQHTASLRTIWGYIGIGIWCLRVMGIPYTRVWSCLSWMRQTSTDIEKGTLQWEDLKTMNTDMYIELRFLFGVITENQWRDIPRYQAHQIVNIFTDASTSYGLGLCIPNFSRDITIAIDLRNITQVKLHINTLEAAAGIIGIFITALGTADVLVNTNIDNTQAIHAISTGISRSPGITALLFLIEHVLHQEQWVSTKLQRADAPSKGIAQETIVIKHPTAEREKEQGGA